MYLVFIFGDSSRMNGIYQFDCAKDSPTQLASWLCKPSSTSGELQICFKQRSIVDTGHSIKKKR